MTRMTRTHHHIIAALAACSLLALAPLTPSTVRAATSSVVHVAGYDAITTVSLLNLRQAPSLQARVLLRLAYGAHLRVHGYTAHWLQVTTASGIMGYVFGRDVRPAPNAFAPHPAQTLFRAPFLVVQARAANLRTAPSLTAPVRLVLAMHTRLALRGTRGNWVLVATQSGITGWMWRPLTLPVA